MRMFAAFIEYFNKMYDSLDEIITITFFLYQELFALSA